MREFLKLLGLARYAVEDGTGGGAAGAGGAAGGEGAGGTPKEGSEQVSRDTQNPGAKTTEQLKAEKDAADADKAFNDARTARAPKTYEEFKLAEGIQKNTEVYELFSAEARKLGLNQAEAQALVDMQGKIETAKATQQTAAWTALEAGWEGECKADKDYGGDNYGKNSHRATAVAKALGLTAAIDELGIKNQPALFRAMNLIADEFGDDKLVFGKGTATPSPNGDGSSKKVPGTKVTEAQATSIYNHPTSRK